VRTLALGAVLSILGILGLAYGIGFAVGSANALADDAVARGVVGAGPVAFETHERKLTVYLDVDGVTNDSNRQDSLASATACDVTARGFEKRFSGSRQGASTTLGDYVSVGSFTLPVSAGRIACSGADGLPYLVTPVGAGDVFGAVGLIIAGVVVAIAGVALAVVGNGRRRRQPS
jgi:hypothetical protein